MDIKQAFSYALLHYAEYKQTTDKTLKSVLGNLQKTHKPRPTTWHIHPDYPNYSKKVNRLKCLRFKAAGISTQKTLTLITQNSCNMSGAHSRFLHLKTAVMPNKW